MQLDALDLRTSAATSDLLSPVMVGGLRTDGGMMEGWQDGWKMCVGEGVPGLWCGMLCADLELVTIGKSQFIFFVTLLCLKHSVSAQMHVGSVLALALMSSVYKNIQNT